MGEVLISLGAVAGDFQFEYMNVGNIRLNAEANHPSWLVDWLLSKDIYIILSQGIHPGMFDSWKPIDCRVEVLRLIKRIGFPSGINLRCPVWNGDKMRYFFGKNNQYISIPYLVS